MVRKRKDKQPKREYVTIHLEFTGEEPLTPSQEARWRMVRTMMMPRRDVTMDDRTRQDGSEEADGSAADDASARRKRGTPLAQGREPYRGPWPPPRAVTEVGLTPSQISKLVDCLLDVAARRGG